MNGLFCQGLNILMAAPNKAKVAGRPGQAQVAGHHRPAGDRDGAVLGEPRRVQQRRPQGDPDRGHPASGVGLCRGGGQRHQLQPRHPVALEGGGRPGRVEERHRDHRRPPSPPARALCQGGRRLPRSDPNLAWSYTKPGNPDPAEVLKEINGYALEDLPDPADPSKVLLAAGKLLPTFGMMRDDGKTSGGCWIYTGVYTEAGNMSMRRDAATRPASASSPTGASPGRPTAACSTTAPRPIPRASRGASARSTCRGTARAGSAATCRTTRRPSRPTSRSARSS